MVAPCPDRLDPGVQDAEAVHRVGDVGRRQLREPRQQFWRRAVKLIGGLAR